MAFSCSNSSWTKVSITLFTLGLAGTVPIFPQIAQAGSITNTKNVIIMIGDGMGWEMARAAAIQKRINAGNTGNSLSNFYTSGKGSGLAFQDLSSDSTRCSTGSSRALSYRWISSLWASGLQVKAAQRIEK
jgi:alkaline phosphatase